MRAAHVHTPHDLVLSLMRPLVSLRYWMDHEPNNHGYQGENCCIVVYSPSSPWKTRYDGNCEVHELAWACEMDARGSLQTRAK